MQRLHVTDDLAPDAQIELSRDQAHYVTHVLRMREGSELLVFNGRHGEYAAELVAVSKRSSRLRLRWRTRSQTQGRDLAYCFAPLKKGRLDYMVQKAVEMGAGVLQPVLTQHTQVPRLGAARMRANVVEAAEQCGVLSLPELREPCALDRLLSDWPPERRLIFCDEGSSANDPLSVLAGLTPGPLAVLVGPEGGFSDMERKVLLALPFVTPLPLGPRILRADTAAVAALALIQATLGDWRRGGPHAEMASG